MIENNRTFIFVGAKPAGNDVANPGGQLTASIGLRYYAKKMGYKLIVLDTTQASFPLPSFRVRSIRGLKRIINLITIILLKRISGIIIFSGSGSSFYERSLMTIICRVANINTLFFMRDGHFAEYIQNSRIRAVIAKYLLRSPNMIGIQGDNWRDFYRKLGVPDKKLITIRNWLPTDIAIHPRKKIKSNNQYIQFCFIGWLVEEKGIVELLSAVKKLSKTIKSFRLVLVGGGTLEEYARSYISENNLEQYIKLTGWQSSKMVKEHLKSSDVYVLPSYAEGFPNSLLEAMAYGLPAICTDVGGIIDTVKHNVNGIIIRKKNVEDIVNAMMKYITQPKLIEIHSAKIVAILRDNHDRDTNCKKLFEQFNYY